MVVDGHCHGIAAGLGPTSQPIACSRAVLPLPWFGILDCLPESPPAKQSTVTVELKYISREIMYGIWHGRRGEFDEFIHVELDLYNGR